MDAATGRGVGGGPHVKRRGSRRRPHRHLTVWGDSAATRRVAAERARLAKRSRRMHDQWAALHHLCADRGSRLRLSRLIHRLMSEDRGVRESAVAELELATLLVRSGFAIRFLPESQARTADLECRLGADRLFVEVTALVGTGRHLHLEAAKRQQLEDEDDDPVGQGIIERLVARVAQKAKQLSDYTAPVVLALTMPPPDPEHGLRNQEVDLKRLAGAVTLLLLSLTHLTGVVIALWEVKGAPMTSAVRLSNVHLVERSAQQAAYPRIRLLITNPAATAPLDEPQLTALKALL